MRARVAARAALVLAAACALAAAGAGAAAAARADAPTWCGGTAEQAADRPDPQAALSWHVLYAYPADGADRFPQLAGPLFADLAAVDAWWRAQDPARAIRWDLADFPGCAGGIASLDLGVLKLSREGAWFAANADRYARIRDDLAGAGFTDPDKKLLVFYDGPLEPGHRECGISRTGSPALGGPDNVAIIYLGDTCGDGLGSGLFPAVAAAHELTHSLGALVQVGAGQAGPPHVCPFVRDGSHVVGGGQPAQPPSAPAGITAVQNSPGAVELRWLTAADDVGPVTYEVWRDGRLVQVTPTLTYGETVADGETHGYLVRARDGVGRLGAGAGVRYTAGRGVVDESGALLRDTVPPSRVALIRARIKGSVFTLSWSAAADAGGVAGYQVLHGTRTVATVRSGTAFSLPARRAPGVWAVRAFDRANNLGDPSPALSVPLPAPGAAVKLR